MDDRDRHVTHAMCSSCASRETVDNVCDVRDSGDMPRRCQRSENSKRDCQCSTPIKRDQACIYSRDFKDNVSLDVPPALSFAVLERTNSMSPRLVVTDNNLYCRHSIIGKGKYKLGWIESNLSVW